STRAIRAHTPTAPAAASRARRSRTSASRAACASRPRRPRRHGNSIDRSDAMSQAPKIRWSVPQNRATLMIPGPTELPWTVIQAMTQPPIIQYDQHFDAKILEPVTLALREVFQTTAGEVIVMPGSGRTALEASAVSLIEPGDRVVVVIAGVFGHLMREI